MIFWVFEYTLKHFVTHFDPPEKVKKEDFNCHHFFPQISNT